MARIDATRQLCEFLAGFRWSEVPDAVIEKTLLRLSISRTARTRSSSWPVEAVPTTWCPRRGRILAK